MKDSHRRRASRTYSESAMVKDVVVVLVALVVRLVLNSGGRCGRSSENYVIYASPR
jgi:hypothetical protein